MGCLRSQWAGLLTTGSAALLAALFTLEARALGVLPSAESRVDLRAVDAIMWMDGGREALIETLVVEPGTEPFALIRAFPSLPTEITAVDPALVSDLRAVSHVGPPYHARVRERLFGPSIMTPLLASVLREPTVPPVEPLPVERPVIARDAFAVFSGRTLTSTITLVRSFPPELERWMSDAAITPTPAQRDLLARFLDRGWYVVAALIPRPATDQPLTVGPWLYRFATPSLILPPALGSAVRPPVQRVYVLGDRPLVPSSRPVVWNEKPYQPHAAAEGPVAPLEVTYWGRRDVDATFRLQGLLPVATPTTAERVLRATLVDASAPSEELTFGPATIPAEVRPIPGRTGRGSGLDLLLSLLLGLAPLLYAPESWLLLWAAANARATRARGQPPGLSAALWPLYALVVALFWLVTLPGLARVAALGPLAVGLYRLFASGPERERGPVRVNFRRTQRPEKDKKDAPRSPPKAAPAGASKPPQAGLSKPPQAGLSKPPQAGLSKPPAPAAARLPGASKPPAPGGVSKPPPAGPAKAGASKPPPKR